MKVVRLLTGGVLLLAGITTVQAQIADPKKKGPVSAEELRLEKLVLEAASYFDEDMSHPRVSEAKAISDLLEVASSPDTKLLLDLLHWRLEKRSDFGPTSLAIYNVRGRLSDLAFVYDQTPSMNGMLYAKVVDGKLYLGPRRERHFSFGSSEMRRDLTPFKSQIMTMAQYAADRRTHGEPEPVPVTKPIAPAILDKLSALLEDARTSYPLRGNDLARRKANGPGTTNWKQGSERFVADLIGVCLEPKTEAILEAGSAFLNNHWRSDRSMSGDNSTAAVLDILEELLWGTAKYHSMHNGVWLGLEEMDGRLRLNPQEIHLMDMADWGDRQNVNTVYWYRRDLSRFSAQARR